MTSGAAGALPDAGTVEVGHPVGARRVADVTFDRACRSATTPSVMTTGSRG